MSARLAGKRVLQAVFVVVAIAGAVAYSFSGLLVFVIGVAGFIGASLIPAKA